MRKKLLLYSSLCMAVFTFKYAQGLSGNLENSNLKNYFKQDTVPKAKTKADSAKAAPVRVVVPAPDSRLDTSRNTKADSTVTSTNPATTNPVTPAAKNIPADTTTKTDVTGAGLNPLGGGGSAPAAVQQPASSTQDTSKAVPTNVSKTVADTGKTVADTTSTPANPTAVIKADSAAVPAGMVSGVVTDQYGPSPGVTVSVKGTDRKAISDPDGKYQIAAGEADVLVFASMGFTAKEEPVGTRKVIDIAMQAEAKELEEVQVVATAYGTVDRRKLTSAVSSIGADQIENEVLPSITQAIQGKAGGVQVTQKSGSPGGGLSIRVRGTTSINASSDPLYVVDGIPVNSTTNFTGGTNFNFGGGTQGINVLSSINPSDVQSVEVLKDAASSSIYGARAANGVVLITTKRGQAGTSSFTFNAYEGFSQVPKERLYKFMNTADYQDYMRDFYKYLVDEDGVSTPVPAGILANPNINTDWQNEIFRVAPTRNYEIAARGGSEKTRYYTSVGYMKQSGVIQNSDFSRLSGRLNLDHEHSDKLKFSTSINLTRALNDRVQEENSKEGSTKNGIVTPPNIPVYNADGSFAFDDVNVSRENPIAMLLLPTNTAETFRVLASGSAEYKFIPELALKTSFGTDISFIDETFFMPPSGIRSFAGQGGIGARRNTRDQLWINETTLTFDKTFGDHSLNALGGISVQESKLEFVDAGRSNFLSSDIPYLSAGGTITGGNSFPEEWAIVSAFSRINYDYKGKYLFTANFRVDGSSRFGANNRYATFPSFAGAWRISDEDFMKSIKAVSNLKLRASWGITGNQNIPNYASYSLYSGSNNYLGAPGFVPNVLGDRNLKWETTEQTNIGIDVGLFDNRISVLADYYIKNTSDLLVGVTVPGSSGFVSRLSNVGEIQNKGFEFEIASRNLVGEFKWNTSLNMGFNRNKVISLPGGDLFGGVGNLNIAREGLPLGTFYGWKMVGVNVDNGLIDYQKNDGTVGAPLDPEDRRVIGDPNPDFFGGITNTFQYKGFDFSVMGQFSYGNDVFNYNLATGLGGSNISSNGLTDWNRRWRNQGDITDVPRPTPNSLDNQAISDRFVEDGSFFRIRNITLGYTFDSKLMERVKVKSLRVYTTVQNAYVFTKYRGYDPEVSSSQAGPTQGLVYGLDYGSYPQPRIFTAGLNLTF